MRSRSPSVLMFILRRQFLVRTERSKSVTGVSSSALCFFVCFSASSSMSISFDAVISFMYSLARG